MTASPEFTTRPQLAGTFGMVASTHWLASAAGMAVLEQGGNAFDAAVAAGFVLQVVEPHLNGPAGEVPVIGFDASSGQPFVLDGQGPAPADATLAAFAALGLDLVPGTGLLAACVPAAFGTWMLLLERYGTLPLRAVLEYAIGYADHGYPMLPTASAAIGAVAGTFRDHWPGSAEIYLAGGVPAPGSRFTNGPLAAVYRRILAEAEQAGPGRERQIEAARHAFYQGFVAEAIAAYAASAEVMDVTGRRHRSLLTADDMAGWRASSEAPVTAEFRGLTVCKTGPWGQGPVFLQQLLLLDGLGADSMQPGSAELIHVVTEAAKLAFADREAWYGDPRQSKVPLAALLSADYAAERRLLVAETASARAAAGCAGRHGTATAELCPGDHRGPAWPTGGWCAGGWGGGASGWSWRHVPSGCRRPVRKLGRGHAERGLAAELSRHSRPRFLSRDQGADVHADAWPCEHTWHPVSGRARRCLPASRYGTASRTWRSARPAGISRISGPWRSSSTTSCTG